MKFSFFSFLLAAAAVTAQSAEPTSDPAPAAKLGSTIYQWDGAAMKPSGVGARRDINDSPSATLLRFECHISMLRPGIPSHPPHQHAQEELIIIKEGTLDVHINGQEQRLGPGGLFFFASNDWHAVRNVGDVPATYLVFNFQTAPTRTAPKAPAAESASPDKLRSAVYAWEDLKVQSTPKGERRDFFKSPTVSCQNFSVHATTLNAGETPHAPHRHPDEEIIVVKEGSVEATINGKSEVVGPGSILFFASNDEHGLRNVGDSPATYYVMRVVTELTPTVAAK